MQNQFTTADDRLSALADGQLAPADAAQTMDCLTTDASQIQTWHAYHVVGDVLRSRELAPSRDGVLFLQKLEQRLALDPVFPRAPDASRAQEPLVVLRHTKSQHSANDPLVRWKVLAGVLCVALLGVLTVQPRGAGFGPDPATLAASMPVQATAATVAVDVDDRRGEVMVRDPALDRLLAAHRQVGGHSALQNTSGFLRNATFEGTSR
jgi:sigma-E factor negative regulatory protein RseA